MSSTFRLGGDLGVRRLGFGAMRIVDCPSERARAVLRRAVELGADLIATADAAVSLPCPDEMAPLEESVGALAA